MNPVKLSEIELNSVLNCLNGNRKERGPARLVRLLADKTLVPTVEINTKCSIGNVSDAVLYQINNKIMSVGFFIACVRPPRAIRNQFGEKTGQYLWSFYRFNKAANDPCYDGGEG